MKQLKAVVFGAGNRGCVYAAEESRKEEKTVRL